MSGKDREMDVDEPCAHAGTLLQGLNELRLGGQLCDIVLQVGGARIQAHRVVLAGCSPYFRAMFTGNLSETENTHVEFKSVESEVMQSLVEFTYTGQVAITQNNVQYLLSAANLLEMQAVVKKCCDFLSAQLHPSNCIGIKRFAEMHSCTDLCKKAFCYLLCHFEDLVDHEEFLQSHEADIVQILSHDDLALSSEWKVFLAIKSWVHYDYESRKHLMPKLINCVRLVLLPLTAIERCMHDDICLEYKSEMQMIFKNSLAYKLEPSLRLTVGATEEFSLVTKPRLSGHMICAVGGKNGTFATLDSVESYAPNTGQWRSLTTLPQCRFECCAVVLLHKLYVLGGMLCKIRGGKPVQHQGGSVQCWNVESKKWSDVSPMQQERSALAVAVVGTCIYALGGYDGESYLSSVECYCPMQDRWKFVRPMLQSRSCFGAATLDGALYAVGGYGPPCLNSVECYMTEHDSWRPCASMSEKRINCGITALRGFLFVVGGHNGAAYLSSMERYDPYTNQWTRVAGMGKPRTGLGLCVIDEKLFAVGGHSGSSYHKTVQCYDPCSDTWTDEQNMNTSRCSFGLTAL